MEKIMQIDAALIFENSQTEELRLRVQGTSMQPFLFNLRDTVVLKKPESVKKGEVNSPVQLSSYMFPPTRREDKTTGRFSADEAGIYQAIIDKKRQTPEEIEAVKLKIIDCNQNGSQNLFPTKFRCRAGRSSFWINWKGEMLACGMMENIVAHPFDEGFEKSWSCINSAIKGMTVLRGCEGCRFTDLCKICPAMVLAETGTFNEKPGYICTMMDKWSKEMLR